MSDVNDTNERLARLERRLANSQRLLAIGFGVNALFALVLVAAAMVWVERKDENGAYLATRPDGTIHALTRVGGEPRRVSLELNTYPGEGGANGTASTVELSATQDGQAAIDVRGIEKGRQRGVSVRSGLAEDPGVVFERDGRRFSVTLDEDGLVVHERLEGERREVARWPAAAPNVAVPPTP